jgi:hypothetical protein
VAVSDALVDWPGRPITLSVSGGRDSRLTFAAAANGSWPFYAKTVSWPYERGFPESADVRVARTLCETAGIAHHLELGSAVYDVRLSAETLSLLAGGVATIGDTGILPGECPPGALELQVTGSGGEIARCRYGAGFASVREAGEAVCGYHLHAVPPAIVNDAGLDLVRGWVREWMARRAQEGVAAAALGDTFYVEERTANWASAVHGTFGYWADTVSPLWTASLASLMFACPAPLRSRDGFHNLVLRELSPELWGVPFAGSTPSWPPLHERRLHSDELAHTLRTLRKLASELRRRVELRHRGADTQHLDPIIDAQRLARELAGAAPEHPAWEILNRKRVAHVLTVDPRTMHPRSRHHIWRLLAVLADHGNVPQTSSTPEAARPAQVLDRVG